MPLYEYECKKCKGKFEKLVSFKNLDNPIECPKCGSKETDRLFSTFAASVKSSASCSARTSGGG